MNAPVKLAIRQDDQAGLVRAYFSRVDDSDRFEVATISTNLVRDCPGAFDAWKEMLTKALSHLLSEAGLEPVGWSVHRPHDKN